MGAMPTPRPRDVVVLGSTGSIGTQALDVVRNAPDRFRVVALAAGGGRPELLARQVAEFDVPTVAVADPASAAGLTAPTVLTGPTAAGELAAHPCDVVLNGMTGSAGLGPTLAALDAGLTVALANKESLIAGGALVRDRITSGKVCRDQIVPVDSEHSALAQCLRSGAAAEVRRLIVTASGGPFRGRTREQLTGVTPADAMAHPTWDMGPVITINSATLINKGLEVIEAHELFDVPYDAITVVVHPQSIVHSMVEFVDGATVAKLSPPDMRLAIALALGWPDRVADAASPMDWTTALTLAFEPLDETAFPAVALARRVGAAGGVVGAVLNAANEELVAAFVAGRLPFLGIVDSLQRIVDEAPDFGQPRDIDDVLHAERWARDRATALVDAE
jgi:1-deoxy-D-xylulose-5-phosphate reductoisomerase